MKQNILHILLILGIIVKLNIFKATWRVSWKKNLILSFTLKALGEKGVKRKGIHCV